MAAVAEQNSVYLQDFQQRDRASEPTWWGTRREAAMQRFEAAGFPSRKVEAWKQTKLAHVTQEHFRAATSAGELDQDAQSRLAVVDDAVRIVFVDGILDAERSQLDRLPDGLTVRTLADALQESGGVAETHLARHADAEAHPFLALNTAFTTEGVVIEVGSGAAPEQPLELVHVMTAGAGSVASWPRVLIHGATSSEVTVVQRYYGANGAAYLTSPVTEIIADANSQVNFYQHVEEGDQGAHLGVIHATVDRDARVKGHALHASGRTVRTDFYVNLDGPGGDATLNGLYLVRNGQFADIHTWVRHNADHCTSQQLMKGVLEGKSEAVFDGMIHVARDAQQTDADQQNRNLLLSPKALAHSNPRLEIYADDVKCGHGSTVGELDEDAVLYMRTRGISDEEARGVLTFAFANEMLEPVAMQSLREYEREALLSLLPGEEAVRKLL
ncbi:Fe-S cluster assembly protein SufD [Aquisalimonas asiatica]|uniref:Iron-regulated ABC transporter permease protein SufD n=1 Tax=Aquisalimonas asiatica TaxID=406100 RepID=A0A1H8SL62_9GAMM|nr:Fe-S cluster assembly protein SufD [Aquisalimonas asiatica]SEO78943.1 Iron-regulated ABC transporter permease protein SufD [Aquisalimonas asiatica]